MSVSLRALRSIGVLCCGVALLTGCLPEIDVTGKVVLTVDTEQRPILLLYPCTGDVTWVNVSADREGLTDNEQNEEIGTWETSESVTEATELDPRALAAPWTGPTVTLETDRGYIASAVGSGEESVLSQVSWRMEALPTLEPGKMYRNLDLDSHDLSEVTAASLCED